jgi:alcohol dehydrogenase class IV
LLLPEIAVLDADLTLGLPPNVTAATGIDAIVHAIEAYASTNPNNNPVSRMLATPSVLSGNHHAGRSLNAETNRRRNSLTQ